MRITLFTALCLIVSHASGYIYKAVYVSGAFPGKHPINVIVLSDFHGDTENFQEQQDAIISACFKLGKRNTVVIAEDNCHYTGSSRVIRENIQEVKDDEEHRQVLSFLINRCEQRGIRAINIDDYRYQRHERASARAFMQELRETERAVAAYSDGPALEAVYQRHLKKGFTSEGTKLVAKTALDYKKRETALEDLFIHYGLERLARKGLIAREIDKRTGKLTYAEIDYEALKEHNDRPGNPIGNVLTESEEMCDDVITFTGTKILDVKAIHTLANLDDQVTNVIICVGGDHAKRIVRMLKKDLNFTSHFTRGEEEADTLSIDLERFFDHYCMNQLERIASHDPANLRERLAPQFGSPFLGSDAVERRIKARQRQ